jgi:hypothetical protein
MYSFGKGMLRVEGIVFVDLRVGLGGGEEVKVSDKATLAGEDGSK